MKNSNFFVSVVVPLKNSSLTVNSLVSDLHSVLSSNFTDYEIIFVDRSSTDSTVQSVSDLLGEIPCVRCIKLSSHVDEDVAFAAGMENAIGDCVVLFRAGYDRASSINSAVELFVEGYDVVVGVANKRATLGYTLVAPLIRFFLRYIGFDLPKNSTSFRCLSRKAVNAVTMTGKFHHKLFVRISRTGFDSTTLSYKPVSLERKTFFSGLRQALSLLVFNSTAPLRWMSVAGAFGSFLSLAFATYSILVNLFLDSVIEGWTSLAFVISFLFMLLFTILAFFGEYLGRILDDRGEHRDYYVADEIHSEVMFDMDRLNVTDI